MYIGWFAACLTGFGLPSWVFLIGDIINSFNPNNPAIDMLDKIKYIAMIQVIVGGGIFLLSYIYYGFLLISSERITKRTRTKYVEAVLR
jgi:hypothetical protein